MYKRFLPSFLLIIYSAVLIKVMVLKDVPIVRTGSVMLNFGGTQEGHANLVPFKTIVPYVLGHKGLIIGGINLIGNIVLLVPVGILIPFIYRGVTWKKVFMLAVGTSFLIETMQVMLRVGIFDIDDVLLNAFGVMIGYWMVRIFTHWVRAKNYISMSIAAVVMVIGVVAAAYIFYPRGQEPITSEIGSDNGRDLCGGTGGTGEFVSLGNSTLTIKRNDGTTQVIPLMKNVSVRNSEGAISIFDLKAGDRITIVVGEHEIASTVLVCLPAEGSKI